MKPKPRRWSSQELEYLRKHYPDTNNADLARELNRTATSVMQCAIKLKLRKSERFRASPESGRRQPGQTPWNKGKTYQPGGRSVEARFRKGHTRNVIHPVGATRVNKDGYVEIKTGDEPFRVRQWEHYHRLVWMRHHGPIPKGCVVVFKPGKHTTNPEEIVIENLEMITRAELMERNTVHRYPAELRGAMIQIGRMRERLNEKHQ